MIYGFTLTQMQRCSDDIFIFLTHIMKLRIQNWEYLHVNSSSLTKMTQTDMKIWYNCDFLEMLIHLQMLDTWVDFEWTMNMVMRKELGAYFQLTISTLAKDERKMPVSCMCFGYIIPNNTLNYTMSVSFLIGCLIKLLCSFIEFKILLMLVSCPGQK